MTQTLTPTEVRLPVIHPCWWTGVLPIPEEEFKIDCSEFQERLAQVQTKEQVPQKLVQRMKDMFAKTGLVLLTNTGLTNAKVMQEIALVALGGKMDYIGGSSARRKLEVGLDKNAPDFQTFDVYDTGVAGEALLHYHHEMSYLSKVPKNIAFSCVRIPQTHAGQGWTYVSEQVQATDELLKTPLGQKLKEKGVCFIRCLTDRKFFEKNFADQEVSWNGYDKVGVYNHWQLSFGVETKEEVEKIAAEKGLQVTWGENNYCRTKYYADAFEYDAVTDRNYLFASLGQDSMLFDTWPGLSNLPTMNDFNSSNYLERPLKVTFGDDTEFTRQELLQFVEIYDKFGFPLKWQVGDIAMICNYRWAHGRPAYTMGKGDERKLGVTLGVLVNRVGQNNDKW